MNPFQKAVRWILERGLTPEEKAVGFPPWNVRDQFPWPGRMGDYFGSSPASLQLAIVYGCARVRSQTFGSLPFHVYREKKSGAREKDTENPLYPILHNSPNEYMTSMEFREAMELAFCIYGNAYAEIVKLGGRIVSLIPLHPDRVIVKVPPTVKSLTYEYSYNGKTEKFEPEQILHVKNFSFDGICGISPIRQHIMEHVQNAQDYGRNFFRNNGRPSGVLTSDQKAPANTEASE